MFNDAFLPVPDQAEFLSLTATAAATGLVANHIQFHAVHLLSQMDVISTDHAGLNAVIFAL